jgi:hypothetical protein
MNAKFSTLMSKGRLAKRVLAGAAVVSAISVGLNLELTGSGIRSTLVGRGTFSDPTEPATNVVTYFAPPGAALRIDQPDPGNCSF